MPIFATFSLTDFSLPFLFSMTNFFPVFFLLYFFYQKKAVFQNRIKGEMNNVARPSEYISKCALAVL